MATVVQMRPGVLSADMAGEIVLLHPDDGAYFALNETGADLWRLLGAGPVDEATLTGEVADRLAAGWEVERSVAEEDARALLAELTQRGLVTRVHP